MMTDDAMMSDDSMMSIGKRSVMGDDGGSSVGSVGGSSMSNNARVVSSYDGTTGSYGGDGATVGANNGGSAAGSLQDLGAGAGQKGEESDNGLKSTISKNDSFSNC
ncbi:hypothetical protein MTP99_001107 [Tenebrio molitor]|jgi:hypothetical protein|nr:hypothetical protein MTP99_001107 [Tenebrio molitor]